MTTVDVAESMYGDALQEIADQDAEERLAAAKLEYGCGHWFCRPVPPPVVAEEA
jgi:hypothetical protein